MHRTPMRKSFGRLKIWPFRKKAPEPSELAQGNQDRRRKLLGKYSEVWIDHDPEIVVRITKEYIVHIDKNGSLDWETSEQYDLESKDSKGFSKTHDNGVKNEAAILETYPCAGLRRDVRDHYRKLIGEGLVCGLEMDYASAKNMFEAANKYIQARSEECSRRWYLTSSIVGTIPFLIAVSIIWPNREWLQSWVGSTVTWLLISACAGALGALFSVIARSGNLKFDCAAGRALHYLEGVSRILAGSISGALISLAISSQIILAGIVQEGNFHTVMILGSLISGAAERLATSIITTFENTHTTIKHEHSQERIETNEA